MDLICLGEILMDMFPAETGRPLGEVSAFRPKPGGAMGNVAVAAHRLGLDSAFIGKVGDDAFGRRLAEVLRAEGVDTRGLMVDAQARTTLAFIAQPDPHHAEFVFYRNPGADILLRPDELDRGLLSSARALHVGGLSLTDEPARSATLEAVRMARQAGALVSFDVNFRPSLWADRAQAVEQAQSMATVVDVIKVNEVELSLLTGTSDAEVGTRALLDLGPALVVLTQGAQGSAYRTRGQYEVVPAFVVETVDATGCGDAFIAGLLAGLVRSSWRPGEAEAPLENIVRYANAVGALTAREQGVIPALPSAEQVEKFLRKSTV